MRIRGGDRERERRQASEILMLCILLTQLCRIFLSRCYHTAVEQAHSFLNMAHLDSLVQAQMYHKILIKGNSHSRARRR